MQRSDLDPYQVDLTQKIIDLPACALFLPMGRGKTIITLTAIVDLLNDYAIARVLVIAPLQICRHVWSQEAAKWRHTQHLKISPIIGTPKQRRFALDIPSDVHCINTENLKWLVDYVEEWPWDMVIFDESSLFKNHATKRFKLIKKLRNIMLRVVLLTGTPCAKSYHDLWSQSWLIDRGERLEKNITRYRNQYFNLDYSGFNYTVKKEEVQTIDQKISDVCFSYRELDLPPPRITVVESPLSGEMSSIYSDMKRTMVAEVEGTTLTATQVANKLNKLQQIAHGHVYVDTGLDQRVKRLHSHKTDALRSIIAEASGSPLLVAYQFKTDWSAISTAFPEAQEFRQIKDVVNKWNTGEIPLLCIHPASAGHGLNLQYGGHIIVWFGLPWSLEHYSQTNARLRRPGQTTTVYEYQILAPGTVDEDIKSRLGGKRETQQALLTRLLVDG